MRHLLRGFSAALVAGVLAVGLLLGAVEPASAYSRPSEVPNPFQDYSAQDYADALWNLETEVGVRTRDQRSSGDCEVITFEVSDPLGDQPTRTYIHIADDDGWWCSGDDADTLRAELDEKDDSSENFFHGRPYENTAQRVPYYGSWADVNGNGVTSRTEIHARDLGNSSFTLSGSYWDHYTGKRVHIGTTETHGEHMIPVGHTWPEMQHRSREDRVAYYNDPMNLTSTIGSVNREKSGHTPSEWMPSNEDAWCGYTMTWVHISAKHEISQYASDIRHLRGILWDCLDEERPDHDADTLPQGRSSDLDWPSLPPEEYPLEQASSGSSPRDMQGKEHYAHAVRLLEREVPVRGVERETRGDCDVQTFTSTHPRTDKRLTLARVISSDNRYCAGSDGDRLRAELEEQAEDSDSFFHGSPLSGQRREYFGYLTQQQDSGLTTRNSVLDRDFNQAEWNSTETGVTGGEFHDPYTGEHHRHTAAETVVDHILPVEHAWIELEHRDADERSAFYNDPKNLLATTRDSQREKAGDGPRNWMPSHEDFQCRYAAAWASTAADYQISLYASDISVLRQSLYQCLTDQG